MISNAMELLCVKLGVDSRGSFSMKSKDGLFLGTIQEHVPLLMLLLHANVHLRCLKLQLINVSGRNSVDEVTSKRITAHYICLGVPIKN